MGVKRNVLWWMVTTALCLTLAGCRAKEQQVIPTPQPSAIPEATVTPAPTPTPTPEPTPPPAPWETDPKGYIMGWLDELLDGEKIYVRFWIHPGSGPTPTIWPTEFGETVRTLFEELDWDGAKLLTWEEQEAEDESWVNIPGAYGVTLNDEDWLGEGYFSLNLNSRVIRVNWEDDQLYFLVPGAEKLCTKLADLSPSVYVNMGRTRVPAQESKKATLKLYLETALERTKGLGHISDYELRHYAVVTEQREDGTWIEEDGAAVESGEEGEYTGFTYTATFAYKPANPQSAYWQDYTADEEGWLEVDLDYGEGLSYDERDGCYGMY